MSDLTPEALDRLEAHADEWEAADGDTARVDLSDLRALLDAARERDRLARWKAEALPVMDGLDRLGGVLGVELGESITARAAIDLALDLRNRAARAERRVAHMQGTEAVLRGEIRRAESALTTFEEVVEERDAAQAEVAALRERVETVYAAGIHADTCGLVLAAFEDFPCSCWKADLRAALVDPATDAG